MHNIFFATALAGVILMIAGLLGAGKLLKFVSYPALIGICLGIGIALLFNLLSDMGLMLGPATDLTRQIDRISPFIARLIRTGTGFQYFTSSRNITNLIAGVVAATLVFVLPKINKKIPSILVAIAVSTGVAYLLGLATGGGNGVGGFLEPWTIYRHLGYVSPEPAWGTHLIRFGDINWAGFGGVSTIMFAFAIAIIAALEGSMSATTVENISKIKYHTNTELFGHGVANLGSGLLGGLPITAAMARTNLNYENGAKSPLAGIFQALYLLLFYALLMPFMRFIPIAALVAPLLKVAITTSFFPLVAKLLRFSKRDASILATTGLITIIFGVHFGVIAGIATSFIVNIPSYKRKLEMVELDENGNIIEEIASVATDTLIATSDENSEAIVTDSRDYKETPALIDEIPSSATVLCDHQQEPKCKDASVVTRVLQVRGAVFFANAHKLVDKVKVMLQHCDEVLVDFKETHSIDATVAERLAKVMKAAAKADKHVAIINPDAKMKHICFLTFCHVIKKW